MTASTHDARILPGNRIVAIDTLRALTMVLMIFVNDLWTLNNIPSWLKHVEPGVDGMGLADAVFPAFLFIVGLSIPFALEARLQRGHSRVEIVPHILSRSAALLVMGVFLVNGEYLHSGATGLSIGAWNTICCTCFILIWNRYPKSFPAAWSRLIKLFAVAILLVLAFYYRGDQTGSLSRFQPRWWGILGLIGWSYLAAALIMLWAGNRILITAVAWALFSLLSLLHHAQLLPGWLKEIPGAISGGSLTALVLAGALSGQCFQRIAPRKDLKKLTVMYTCISIGWLGLAVLTRPYWGLAKLGATPAWQFLCSGLTLLAFLGMYAITEVWGKQGWLSIIRPAGTDTLLTYLLPYFIYAAVSVLSVSLPDYLLQGAAGLCKSLVFALGCVALTRQLRRWGVQLNL